MDELSDEMLMALADGELDASEAAEVEARLEHDPRSRETLRIYRESAALARAAFDDTLTQEVPTRLLRSVRATREPHVSGISAKSRLRGALVGRAALPLAASIALCVGLGLGYQLTDRRGSGTGAIGEMVTHVPEATPLHRALDQLPSGQSLSWESDTASGGGSVTPVLTFKTADARYCREFRLAAGVPAGPGGRNASGLACRGEDGKWRLELLVAGDSHNVQGDSEVFRPAGAGTAQVLDALIDELAAGPTLDATEEAAAMARGWTP